MRLDQEATSNLTPAIPPSLASLPPDLWGFVHEVPFQVDKEPLDFASHGYLEPIYRMITYDRKRSPDGFTFTSMKGAQVGMTITAFGALLLAALRFWGRKFGYFLPTQQMAYDFSSDRFVPLLQSNPFLASLYSEAAARRGKKVDDRMGLRRIGESSVYFKHMHGKDSTESIPMAGVWFDEVRRMYVHDIERAEERISHAAYPINVKISTAGHPDTTIDLFFRKSTQHVWHSTCRCKDGVALAWCWPECIGERRGEVFYRCPRCDKRIDQPGIGRFLPRTPEKAPHLGVHVPQILSPRKTAAMLLQKWMDATDRQEFMNSTLGIPYTDPESILVPESIARTCVSPTLRWAREGTNCVMGVDQRPNEVHVVIADRDKKLRLRHLEIIQGDEPFDRLYPLMEQFDVDCCVIDAEPQYNPAVQFAKTFKRRVFLAYYTPSLHMIRWSDRDIKATERTEKDAKFEFYVLIDRYKAIEYALMQWVLRRVVCPPPEALTQDVLVKGIKRVSQICLGNRETGEQGLFLHLRSVARRKVERQRHDTKEKETFQAGEYEMVWEEMGVDPHFLHAFLYCCVAAARRPSTTELWIPEAGTVQSTSAEDLRAAKPKMTPQQAGDQAQFNARLAPALPLPDIRRETCGACVRLANDQVTCTFHGFRVTPAMPRCDDGYLEKEPTP